MISFPEFWTGFAYSGTIWLSFGLLLAWFLKRRAAMAHAVLLAGALATLASPLLWLMTQWADWGLLPPVPMGSNVPEASLANFEGSGEPRVTENNKSESFRQSDQGNSLLRQVSSRPNASVQGPESSVGMPAGSQNPEHAEWLANGNANEPVERSTSPDSIIREIPLEEGRGWHPSFSWLIPMAWIWIGWSLLSFAKLVFDLVRTASAVSRHCEPSPPYFQESLQRAAAQQRFMGRLPRIRQAEWVGSPSLWAWSARPTILIAPGLPKDSHADAIFCHELAHWVRGDHWGALLGEVLFCLLPWHPLAWWTRSAIKRFSEEACDDRTIEAGCSPVDYAEALVAIAAGKSLRLSLPAVSPHSPLGDRVRRILAEGFRPYGVDRIWLTVAGILMAMLLVFVALMRHRSGASARTDETQAQDGSEALIAKEAESQELAAPDPGAEVKLPESTKLTFVDEAGKPVPGVKIEGRSFFAKAVNGKKSVASAPLEATTGDDGAIVFALEKDHHQLSFSTKKEGYIGIRKDAYVDENNKNIVILPNYKFVLEKGVKIGGTIVDAKNNPIQNANLNIYLNGVYNYNETSVGALKTMDASASYSQQWEAVTDAMGRWSIHHFPAHPLATPIISITHPDFLPQRASVEGKQGDRIALAELLLDKAVIKMAAGFRVQGKITDPDGKPIPGVRGATTNSDAHYRNTEEILVESSGLFRSNAYKEGIVQLSVVAPGYGPQSRTISVGKGEPDQHIILEPRGPVRIRLVDSLGKPVPDVNVYPERYYFTDRILGKAHSFTREFESSEPAKKSNQNGEWSWTWPTEELNEIQIGERDYYEPRKRSWQPLTVTIKAGDPIKTVVLKEVPPVSGRVTDERTGLPIPGCLIIQQSYQGSLNQGRWYSEGNAKVEKDGEFSLIPCRNDLKLRLRVQAPGYLAQHGAEFRVGSEIPNPQNFALRQARTVRGTFLDPSGKTMGKVGAYIGTSYKYALPGWSKEADFYTDENGGFSFDDPGEPFTILVRNSAGVFTGIFQAGQADLGNLVLTAPARVKGTLLFDNEPVARTSINLTHVSASEEKQVNFREPGDTAKTDEQGRFEFPSVLPGQVTLEARLWNSEPIYLRSGPGQGLTLVSGKETEIVLGGNGVQLTGNIQVGGDRTRDLSEAVVHLLRRRPGSTWPSATTLAWFNESGHHGHQGASNKKVKYLSDHSYWVGKVTKEGDFHLSGIPEGEYDLQVVNDPYALWERPFYTNFVRKVTVTAEDARMGKRHLPNIQGPVVGHSAIGSKPDLSFVKADGQKGALSDFRGGFLLVAFRSDWTNHRSTMAGQLEKVSMNIGPERIRILQIDLDDPPSSHANITENIINPSIQARLTTKLGDLPLYSPDDLWVIDPSGTVISDLAWYVDLEKILQYYKK